MNWWWLSLLLTGTGEVPAEPAAAEDNNTVTSQQPQPDLELLMFLGEWSDADADQWLDPTTLIEDNELTRQLDKEYPNETHHPDHH
jgi:hypothetical protein